MQASLAPWIPELRARALRSLEANLVETKRGLFLAAGAHQFRTLWTRDFCFSVPGLLAAGWRDLVERQLKLILSYLELGSLPRGIDAVNPKARVVCATAFRFLPSPFGRAYEGALRPERLGEHGTPPIDSNLLFLRAWSQYVQAGGDWGPVAAQVPELLQPYTALLSRGELRQPAYSDWQDSARREGVVLHTQLLLWEVLSTLNEVHLLPAPFVVYEEPLQALVSSRRETASELYREHYREGQYALDSHLLLLGSPRPLAESLGRLRPELYRRLKETPLWRRRPGLPIDPPYAAEEISLTTKLVGLRHYHDDFTWGWLVAESARVALEQEDPAEAVALLGLLAQSGGASEPLAEIYEGARGALRPVRRALYRSEAPFTWTAAKTLEALALLAPPT